MGGDPRILAAFVQGTLDVVQRCERAHQLEISSRVDAATRERIRAAASISWLPLAYDVELTDRLFQVAGPERARAVLREVMAEAMEKRFLRALAQGAAALLGGSPERLLRWAPKAWDAVYRDAGSLGVIDFGEGVGLRLRGAPEAILESPDYYRGTGAAVEGALAWFDVDAVCRVDPSPPAPLIEVTWKPSS